MYIYVATPYTHDDWCIVESRYQKAMEYTAYLMRKHPDEIHLPPFSPIVHCHELAKKHKMPGIYTFWESYCIAMLRPASELHVLMIDGWESSTGVTGEINEAVDTGKLICYVDPDSFEIVRTYQEK